MRWRFAVLAACGVALVPAAVAVQAWDQSAVMEPATAGAPAVRDPESIQVTPTVAPPSIRQIVNGLHYQHYNDAPAMIAYRLVAADHGWDSQRILAWQPFVRDVMLGESAFCWNRRRGDAIISYSVGCIASHQGTHEDVGFGQVTTAWYGANAILCQKYGVCHSSQILASPYDSMLYSIVIPIELAGSQPWCFNSRARAYHPTCRWAPG
jgi:hypothetical protein